MDRGTHFLKFGPSSTHSNTIDLCMDTPDDGPASANTLQYPGFTTEAKTFFLILLHSTYIKMFYKRSQIFRMLSKHNNFAKIKKALKLAGFRKYLIKTK